MVDIVSPEEAKETPPEERAAARENNFPLPRSAQASSFTRAICSFIPLSL